MKVFVTKNEGTLVKALPQDFAANYVIHRQFGLVSEQSFRQRIHQKGRAGFRLSRIPTPDCRFTLTPDFRLEGLENCKAESRGDKQWMLSTPAGEFFITRAQEATTLVVPAAEADTGFKEVVATVVVLALLLISFLTFVHPKTNDQLTQAQENLIIKAVKITKPPVIKTHAVAPTEDSVPKDVVQPKETKVVHKALPKSLGFLGMVGSKDLKKALGGVPTTPGASPGAGPGGSEGSGGELLTGLGEGVRRTTVGNSGVVGLGGIGTKGRGGGGGGYGNALVGSGDGKGGLSRLAMTEDIVLDGGLDRATINATIAKYLSEVRACYEKGLEGHPGLQGQVNMNFEIGASGNLNFARVAKSTLGSQMVEGCISQRMLNWKFPKPVGAVNVKVNYPFVLRPVGA